MNELAIVSGKGGTGKTTIASSFSSLLKRCIITDCDVDASNLYLILDPEIFEQNEFKGSKVAKIDEDKCILCGICRENCRFDAISEDYIVDEISCEGCKVCQLVCPQDAVKIVLKITGSIYKSKIKKGFLFYADLLPGEGSSGRLVTNLRTNSKIFSNFENIDEILIDSASGIGCPVISSLTNVNKAIIVTEPTVSGIHDLKRILSLLIHFKIKSYVLINKYNINEEKSYEIEDFCKKDNIELIGKIPFDEIVVEAMVNGKSVIDYAPQSKISSIIKEIFKKVYLK